MKRKLLTGVVVLSLLMSMAGCATQPSSSDGNSSAVSDPAPVVENVEGTLEEIMEKIYAGVDVELPMLGNMEITPENESYYLGTTDLGYTEALASEPMMSSIAYSVCLVRMENVEDVEAAKEAIRENVDPRKWICVEVDADKIIVDNIGDLIILIMNNDVGDVLHESFLALKDVAE